MGEGADAVIEPVEPPVSCGMDAYGVRPGGHVVGVGARGEPAVRRLGDLRIKKAAISTRLVATYERPARPRRTATRAGPFRGRRAPVGPHAVRGVRRSMVDTALYRHEGRAD